MARYERARVEKLIPGIWDEWRVLELPDECRPDPDMPKAPQADPRRSTEKVTELADIQRAWALASLTAQQRQAVVLVYGLDYTTRLAGAHMGVTQQAASERAVAGITRLMNYLNGDDDECTDTE